MNEYLYQFIPNNFLYLTEKKKIIFNGKNLKTDYIINIINDIIIKYMFNDNKETTFNLWSIILKEKYGVNYNYYINYLLENGFMKLFSDYFVNKKSKTYIIDEHIIDNLTRIKITDKILIKKNQKEYKNKFITDYSKSPIDKDIQKKLLDDIYHVDIDFKNSIKTLDDLKLNHRITDYKYYRNLFSINNIKNKNLYFISDGYGRIHTNFTILRKEIRKDYLTIDNMELYEIDIKNSQPFFLSLLIKDKMDINDEEIKKYMWLVDNGLLYEHFLDKYSELFITRDDIKLMIYKVLFGKNNHENKFNKIFRDDFPKIYDFIKNYKNENNSYKSLSHKLQRIESEFIFDNVIREIMDKYPEIRMITIHDSIMVPYKYKEKVEIIFNKNLNKFKKSII